MRMLFDEIVRAAGQIIVLLAIPFLVWILAARKRRNFLSWIGLRKPVVSERGRLVVGIVATVVVAVALSSVLDRLSPNDVQLANARFAERGFDALPGAVVFSFFATALPEEILFRGFLGQHLSRRLGFAAGNTIQSILFGLLHGVAFFAVLDVLLAAAVIAFTGTLGWIMGYVNRRAGDSIWPSVILHGLSNVYACVMVMFSLH